MKTKRRKFIRRPTKRRFITVAAYESDHEELNGMITEDRRSIAQVIRHLINQEKTRLRYEMQNASETPSAMQNAG